MMNLGHSNSAEYDNHNAVCPQYLSAGAKMAKGGSSKQHVVIVFGILAPMIMRMRLIMLMMRRTMMMRGGRFQQHVLPIIIIIITIIIALKAAGAPQSPKTWHRHRSLHTATTKPNTTWYIPSFILLQLRARPNIYNIYNTTIEGGPMGRNQDISSQTTGLKCWI